MVVLNDKDADLLASKFRKSIECIDKRIDEVSKDIRIMGGSDGDNGMMSFLKKLFKDNKDINELSDKVLVSAKELLGQLRKDKIEMQRCIALLIAGSDQ